MSPKVCRLLGRAIVRHIAGDRRKAMELSSRAKEIHDRECHLYVSIGEILKHKQYGVV